MAQKLAGGNVALALLCNTIPTGAILVVLILIFGPISGAHFNPAVSVAFAMRRQLPWAIAAVSSRKSLEPLLEYGRPISCLNCQCGNFPSRQAPALGSGSLKLLPRSACYSRSSAALRERWLPFLTRLASTLRRPIGSPLQCRLRSGRDDRAIAVGYVRRHSALGRDRLHRGSACRNADRGRGRAMALAGALVG